MLRQPLSLRARLLLATGAALVAFLGLTAIALENAFRQSALTATRDRLQGYVHAYLAASDVSISGRLILPEVAPEPRFDRPASGLYAGVRGAGLVWNSGSAVGRELPFRDDLKAGELVFAGPLDADVGGVYLLAYGVAWELPDGSEVLFTFNVAEHQANLNRQLRSFRRTLWRWLGGVALLLLAVQLAVLRWSLAPLRQVVHELDRVEHGDQARIEGVYPDELTRLSSRLNDFIVNERDNLDRYRRTLADLAHSLKTPLAVLRSQLDSGPPSPEQAAEALRQVERMDGIVAYQLRRAATSGHTLFGTPIPVEDCAGDIVDTLEKLHRHSGKICEFDVAPNSVFHGEKGDLMEVLGNLLENAFKWGRSRILLQARPIQTPGCTRPGLELIVDDDGPGIPPEQVEALLQRGVRGDERVCGHGIGLSIVQDVVNDYHGELRVERSPDKGGARFIVRFPPLR